MAISFHLRLPSSAERLTLDHLHLSSGECRVATCITMWIQKATFQDLTLKSAVAAHGPGALAPSRRASSSPAAASVPRGPLRTQTHLSIVTGTRWLPKKSYQMQKSKALGVNCRFVSE